MENRSQNKLKYYLGNETMEPHPFRVYDDRVLACLQELSKALRADREAKQYPDVLTFAFWCRKANLQRYRDARDDCAKRMGRGVVFHIAPSNVPVNFAYSLAFGMLSGNGNIVRVSEKDFPQVEIICRHLRALLGREEYRILERQTQVVSYPHDREQNDRYSALCDGRVIWGGDRTIQALRESPIGCRCVELTFADRYAFAVLDAQAVCKMDEKALDRLAVDFYNDTYLMDQNACSSPHLVLWRGDESGDGRERFWRALYRVVKERYDLSGKKVMDKYTILCETAAKHPEVSGVTHYGNALYVAALSALPETVEELRGRFGLFFETTFESWEQIGSKLTQRTQTLVSYGVDRQAVREALLQYGIRGIDRIVPVGKALDIGVYWDGYDVVGTLSRRIVVG